MARFGKSHAKELSQVMPLPRGRTPSSATLHRLSRNINFEQLCNQFNNWMQQYFKKETISINGKSITSTVESANESEQNFVSLVSFFGQKSQLIWYAGKLESGKSSEIKKVPQLINDFNITHSIFTLDALHCQKKTVETIIDSNNDYVMTVKKNQPKSHKTIEEQTQTKAEDRFYMKTKRTWA